MKHLFANGDSHTIGTYTKDCEKTGIRELKRPFAKQLAEKIGLSYTNLAEAGGSNNRIIRTTIDALPSLDPAETFILIGWSSWNRTEWYWNNKWHAMCGDPGYSTPEFAKIHWQQNLDHGCNQYQNSVSWHDQWAKSKEYEHAIWVFHHLLNNLGYKFLFFLACYTNYFLWESENEITTKLPWLPNTWAHDPYEPTGFSNFCINRGHKYDEWWHFDEAAHSDYADYLTPYIKLKLP
jgi:hypothetical protein